MRSQVCVVKRGYNVYDCVRCTATLVKPSSDLYDVFIIGHSDR